MNVLGLHLMLDLNECNRELLNDLPYIKKAMIQVADRIGAHVIGESFHQFKPQGVTGVLAIAESHIFIHTWPEYSYAAVDIFSCGNSFNAEIARETLTLGIKSKKQTVTRIDRGLQEAHYEVDVASSQKVHYE